MKQNERAIKNQQRDPLLIWNVSITIIAFLQVNKKGQLLNDTLSTEFHKQFRVE